MKKAELIPGKLYRHKGDYEVARLFCTTRKSNIGLPKGTIFLYVGECSYRPIESAVFSEFLSGSDGRLYILHLALAEEELERVC